jgi:hypothetical protein
MRRLLIAAPLVAACLLATGASCDSEPASNANPAPEFSTVVTDSPAPAVSTAAPKPGNSTPPAASWPSPEDCVSYNPATVTNNYAAGIHQVSAGTTMLLRFMGGPEEMHGTQGVNVAKRYRKLCFLGKNNGREEKGEYVFEYWRDASGSTPAVPDESCSNYDRNNLTVENMGSGQGWRVKDHDNPLQLFDNEADARNGKLVLAKYGKICYLGRGDDGEGKVTYFPGG